MTVYRGTKCKIFYNPTHAKTRTANSVAHEISHVVLEHEPGPVLTRKGTRSGTRPRRTRLIGWPGRCWSRGRAPCAGSRPGGSMTDGAAQFGVSAQLFSWRARRTGVVVQLGVAARPERYRQARSGARGRRPGRGRLGSSTGVARLPTRASRADARR